MTTAAYTLLYMGERIAGTEEGAWFETGGRYRGWVFDLDLARIEAGQTVQVTIETSPTAEDGTWTEVADFTALGTEGRYRIRLDDPEETGEITSADIYLRAVATGTGAHSIRVTGRAPFLDPGQEDDLDLLHQEVRDWDEGRERIVEDAEAVVIRGYIGTDDDGTLQTDATRNGFLESMRLAIAAQAWHMFRVKRLGESSDAGKQKTAREAATIAPEVGTYLDQYLPTGKYIWLGRG